MITNQKVLTLNEMECIKKENDDLKKKVFSSNEILVKFKIWSKRLDAMLVFQIKGLLKEGLGYKRGNPFIITHKPLKKL